MKKLFGLMLALVLLASLCVPVMATSLSPDPVAYASTQMVELNGVPVELEAYALKDENGYLTNYVKLRDIAFLLDGTSAQYDVAWDGAIKIVTGMPYTANGSEMYTPFSGNRVYNVYTTPTKINGSAESLVAIQLMDDAGGGYTYYQLRDLGRALGFHVDWSAERGIFIETAEWNQELPSDWTDWKEAEDDWDDLDSADGWDGWSDSNGSDGEPDRPFGTQGGGVWIPTRGGTKYHTNPGCSNMIDPVEVTLNQAVLWGYTACKRCH